MLEAGGLVAPVRAAGGSASCWEAPVAVVRMLPAVAGLAARVHEESVLRMGEDRRPARRAARTGAAGRPVAVARLSAPGGTLRAVTTSDDHKAHLLRALQAGREALLWKLDGLSERDVRWPVVPTGTNLLGLVKHVASVEAGYFGEVFDRPFPEPLPWLEDDAEPNADMWATVDESRAEVLGLYDRVRAHTEATVAALPLDAPGVVPWWSPEKKDVTLHRVLVHFVVETARHAGHADVVRELLDGAAGRQPGSDGLPEQDEAWWREHRKRLEQVATAAGERRLR